MKKLFILGGVLVLTACATSAKYGKMLDTWIGASESSLLQSWGTPVNFYESGDMIYLTYTSSRTLNMPGQAPSYNITSTGYGRATATPYGGYSASTYNFSCTTTFTIRNGKVISYTFYGNDCRSDYSPADTDCMGTSGCPV